MAQKSVTPSIKETAFDCPHCGANTTQTWYDLYAGVRPSEGRTPYVAEPAALEIIRDDKIFQYEVKQKLLASIEKQLTGFVCLHHESEYKYGFAVFNLHISQCYNCGEFAVWVYDKLLFPESKEGPPPNPDMPHGVKADYEEASKILNLSPRGTAALLRLAIQKLCGELGENGKDINDDISILVKKGLSPLVQKALDSVRVIGNEAVHPGTLDLKDDRNTANNLFRAVNIIVEQMISNQKHVKELFEKLPEEKKKAIERRDKPPPDDTVGS